MTLGAFFSGRNPFYKLFRPSPLSERVKGTLKTSFMCLAELELILFRGESLGDAYAYY